VEGARHYEVTVRDAGSGRILFGETVVDTGIEIPLGPGKYEARISAVNVFRRVFAEGEWTPFSIRLTAELKSLAVQAGDFYAGASSAGLFIRGQGLLPDTSARLEGPGGSLAAYSVSLAKDGLTMEFDTSRVLPGSYDLVLENPGGLSSRIPDAIRVAPRTAPEIIGFERLRLANDRVHTDLQLLGSGLSEGTEVLFRSPSGVVFLPSRKVLEPEGLLRFSLNLAEAPGGQYLLELVNPGGLKTSLADALHVVDVLAGETLGTESPAEVIESTPVAVLDPGFERRLHPVVGKLPGKELLVEPTSDAGLDTTTSATPATETGTTEILRGMMDDVPLVDPTAKSDLNRILWLGVAYRPGYIVRHDTGADFGLSYLGASLAGGVSLKGFNPESWFFRALSTEIRLDFNRFEGLVDEGQGGTLDISCFGATTHFAFSWFMTANFHLNLRAGYGLALSLVDRVSPSGSVSITSQDLVLASGGSLRYLAGRWILETGIDWQGMFYVGATIHAVIPYMRIGLWLN
jgi:hypothetical protein